MKFGTFLFLLFSYLLSFSQGLEKEIIAFTDKDTLWGTLESPTVDLDTTKPLVLIIAGSGPTDRNGNNVMMTNNSLKMIAEGLSRMGYPSIRYDKRGVGMSASAYLPEEDLTFNQNVLDAELFYDYAKSKGYSKIAIAGHSEGSLIGLLLAKKKKAYKYISIAGAGRPIDEVLKEQYNATAPIVRDSAHSIIDSLKKGIKIETLSPWLYSVFRPGIQNYIISWMQIDPAIELDSVDCPKLILQGTTDIQVAVKDANRLKELNPEASLVIIDQMNHVLKKVSSDKKENRESYNKPNLPLHSDLIFEIVKFLKLK